MSKTSYIFLKTVTLVMMLIVGANQLSAQSVNNGIFFQAVARDNFSNPAKERKIYVQSSVIQTTTNGTSLLVEQFQVNTDGTGMFSISIGNGTRVGGTASGLNAIDWSQGPFFLNLKIAITPAAGNVGWDYTKEWVNIGTTSFGAVPYALYSANAGGVNQKLSITDTTKMLSIYAKAQAVQALTTTVDKKLSFSDTASMLVPYIRASLVLDSAYINTQLKSKANTTDVNTALNLKATTTDVTTSLATKVDKVTGKDLSTNDYTTVEKTKLAAITGTNTGDQDLSALATNTALALKANTTDVNTALNLKANASDVATSLANIVDLTSAQTIVGRKTLSSDITVNGVMIGKGGNTQADNISIGNGARSGNINTGGNANIAIGTDAQKNNKGFYNVSVGNANLVNGSGDENTAIGYTVMSNNTSGIRNTGVGLFSFYQNTTGNYNTAIGHGSLGVNTTGSYNTALGTSADVATNNLTNSTAIGAGAIVSTSNTIQLGNTSVTDVKTSGTLTAGAVTYPIIHGTNGQVLSTTGSGILTWTTPATIATSYSGILPIANGGTGSSTLTGLVKGNGTSAMTAAVAGTDYLVPTGSAASLTNFPTLNQNTTGNAATATTAGNITATANTTLTSLSNLATVGTIISGVWSGTAVAIEKGGTGLTSAGTNGQVLTSTGSGTLSWTTPSTTATAYNGVLPIANGGTGSSTQNFVDLTTGQYIDGTKTFKENILVNYGTDGTQAVRIGAQGGNYNTMFGAATFLYGIPGSNNTAIGGFALSSLNGGNENTAVGLNAIRQGGAADGSRNTAVGVASLSNGSGSNDNTAIGTYTLAGSITGASNVAVGNFSLQNNTSANYNVGVGYESLKNTTTGGNNTAIGHNSMLSNTSGDVNTAVGENSLISNTIGRYNTAIGVQAQEQNTIGVQNTAIGVAAIDRNTAGNNNAVLGAFSGRYIADNSTYNTAIDNSVLVGALSRPLANNANNEIVIGYNAIGNGSNTVTIGNTSITNLKTSGTITADAVTYPKAHGAPGQVLSTTGSGTLSWTTVSGGVPYTGATGAVNLGTYDLTVNGLTVGKGAGGISSNTAIGLNALNSNTIGRLNTTTGVSALYSNTSGEFNTSNGYEALYSNTTGSSNTGIGLVSLYSNITGSNNIANGSYALYSNTSGSNNTGIGWAALYNNTTANRNTAIGFQSLRLNTIGYSNTAIGSEALYNNTTGYNNTATGDNALYSNTTAVSNNAYGTNALYSNTTGYSNNAFGFQSLYTNTIGSANTGYGQSTLYLNTTGSNNTAIGYSALDNNTTGSNNTAIGYEADVVSNNLTNATAIGYQATVAASNTIQLGNTSVTNVKTSGTITANAITYPNTAGTNGQVLTSNGSGTASWQSKSAVSHSKFVDATTASVITVGNLQFRFNTSTESLEVLSPSGFKNVQVFATKKTYTSNTSDDGTIKNYFQNENYFDYWNPIIRLDGYTTPITIGTYQTCEFHIHNIGFGSDPVMPNESYKVFVAKDGYNMILLRVDFAN